MLEIVERRSTKCMEELLYQQKLRDLEQGICEIVDRAFKRYDERLGKICKKWEILFQEKKEKFEIEEQVPINDVDMAEEDHNIEKFDVQKLKSVLPKVRPRQKAHETELQAVKDEEEVEIHISLATKEENSQEVDVKAHIFKLKLELVDHDVSKK
ncbi:hypothetical protein GH714_007851 [Hevea brasiliensis]|uniref:Uncharacterized protein n=1 Tax=Hevea brasiliensis TaxID=3981 RepID=A0A6A6KMU7_HEVBR|nr:hypothetical protein GH714_007851 [Hevea brasiliensis]